MEQETSGKKLKEKWQGEKCDICSMKRRDEVLVRENEIKEVLNQHFVMNESVGGREVTCWSKDHCWAARSTWGGGER